MSAAGDLLRRARERIATPERWTKGAFVRGSSAAWAPWGPDACLCADGALVEVSLGFAPQYGVSGYLTRAATRFGFETASRMNDAPETTHADVMALFDEAIALAETEAPR